MTVAEIGVSVDAEPRGVPLHCRHFPLEGGSDSLSQILINRVSVDMESVTDMGGQMD
jgi:hypothetical protein